MSTATTDLLPMVKTENVILKDAIVALFSENNIAYAVRAEDRQADVSGTGPDEDPMWTTITTYYIDVSADKRDSLRSARRAAIAANPPQTCGTNDERASRNEAEIATQITAMRNAIA